MAGKKHSKKKRFQQINRPKVQQAQADMTQPADTSAAMSATAPAVKPATAAKPAPAAKPVPAGKGASVAAKIISHEYFTSDLKRIGIFMAIIIVVLIILGIALK